uniref:Uncharacterized protein n=1 Tax=Arundo donax TaxID=35708 RepID=A0A0A9GFU3_ARUDO
MEWWRGSGRRR